MRHLIGRLEHASRGGHLRPTSTRGLPNWNFHNPWRSRWFCRCIILTYSWHKCLGLRRRWSCFVRFDCFRHLSYPPRHRDRRDGLGGTLEAARQCVCESTHLLDQQTAVRSTMRHGLYNGKLDRKLNHICWDKEIVKTVHPQLTIWLRRNGSNKVLDHKWFSHAIYTHATNSIDHR